MTIYPIPQLPAPLTKPLTPLAAKPAGPVVVRPDVLEAALAWAVAQSGLGHRSGYDQSAFYESRRGWWGRGPSRVTMCLAGRLAVSAGWVPIIGGEPFRRGLSRVEHATHCHRDGVIRNIPAVAAEVLLGRPVTDDEPVTEDGGVFELFAGGPTLRELYRTAAELTGGYITPPTWLLPDGS